MKITLTKEHWDRALAEVPATLGNGAGKTKTYGQCCLVAQALYANGYQVRSVGHRVFYTTDGKGYRGGEAQNTLVKAFDLAETRQRARANGHLDVPETVVPAFPIELEFEAMEEALAPAVDPSKGTTC